MPKDSGDRFERDIKLAETCMTLAAFGASRHDARRSIEWKLSFAIWALMAAATLRGVTALPMWFAFAPLAHAWWLRNLWLRHAADNGLVWNFVNEAQRLLSGHGVSTIAPKPQLLIGRGKPQQGWWSWYGFLGDWGLMFQLIVTASLTAAVFATSDRITKFELLLSPSAG